MAALMSVSDPSSPSHGQGPVTMKSLAPASLTASDSPQLFISRPLFDLLRTAEVKSWSHWAFLAQEACGGVAISAAHLTGLAALQRASLDLLEAYGRLAPERFSAVRTGCAWRAETLAGLESLRMRWSCVGHGDAVPFCLLLDALFDNAALSRLSRPLGRDTWERERGLRQAATAVSELERHEPVSAPFAETCQDALRGPSRAHPEDLDAQLRWVQDCWAPHLSKSARELILLALDLFEEGQRFRGQGPGPVQAPGLGGSSAGKVLGGAPGDPGYVDGEARFSEDADWMPQVVMIAKQSYVWLEQLSTRFGRSITRLDQIPDEALDSLASQGFTGLWLIGLWERSPASREIKRRRGNVEAESSAYALRDYVIAERLGGEEALDRLRERARARGIRLAADMVPNHMGMDSRWMVDHPERFLSLSHPPYPGYTFNGPNVSGDDRVGIYLEDGYWDERDAAVVFKAVDHRSGEVRYVYHGNDGTQMPWNDTAQLDYLQPQVREAVIQTILEVARRFPLIRFDAAMTLARKHISRLWYPPPGQGGAIPSRSEQTVPSEVFDRLLPGEFWREVVDRVREEVPDTLLLAEAFWMMEGYFVRTLGMHRVYNSAFMHMLRDEDNAGYRHAIKGVLEYSPAILERYVNFMNNPDEETAVAQFGKGDKYFGIATMMATLPGLPMFGHGQVEGFAEKYGMEFSRAYRDEQPDEGLIEHHERVIFPLLRDRHLFSGVKHFALMDFWRDGAVDENVFAYANRSVNGGYPSLVLYNNAYESTAGWIHMSTAINIGTSDEPALEQRSLGEALGLLDASNVYYGLWELHSRSWLLRSGAELCGPGLFATLSGYQALVFMGFREIEDPEGKIAQYAARDARDWIPDLDAALADVLAPVARVEGEISRSGECVDPALEDSLTGSDVLASEQEPEEVSTLSGVLASEPEGPEA